MAKIDAQILNRMFQFSGVDKAELYAALRKMGKAELKPDLRDEWTPENPTRNFCYVIAEFVHKFIAPANSQAFRLKVEGDIAEHWFIRWPNGALVDLAAEQFEDYSKIHYENAKKAKFMHPSPSRRARKLAELMGIDD